MKWLIDTHAILWCAQDGGSLSSAARAVMLNEVCYYSIVSLWEVAIKQGQGKLDADFTIEELDRFCRDAGFLPLPITPAALERVKTLPDIHRDPFDRLLVAQALEENLAVVTRDRMIPQYPVQTIW